MRKRTALLILGVAGSLGIGGYTAYRSPLVRSWFARDFDSPREKQRIADSQAEDRPPAPAGTGWPQWRGPHRDGVAADEPFRTDWDKTPPKQLWNTSCGGGYSSLAIVGSRLYTQDKLNDRERVICLDTDSGRMHWEYAYPVDYSGLKMGYATGPRATPTIDGNRLYAVGAIGKFICLELPDGGAQPRLLWERDLLAEFRATLPSWGVACSPLVEDDLVIVQPGGKDGAVAAFSKATGELRWKAGSNAAGYSSPVAATVGGMRVIYALTGDALLCVRAADGAVLGEYAWTTMHRGNIATPVVHDQWVFISSGYNKGCALLRAERDGPGVVLNEVYVRSNKLMRNHHSTCVFRDWHLYGFDDSRLACIDFKLGKTVWECPDSAKGSLILAGNHLIALTESGSLWLLEATPTEFRQIASIPSGLGRAQSWATPCLSAGRLYLRDGEKVICLDVRPK